MGYIKGLVSVVIPTYKRSDMLFRAVDSVCNQTYENLEIIVVNDNIRNDEFSLELHEKMKRYSEDSRVILLEQEKHINGAAARNAGIRYAKGEYLCFLDDDDWWEPVKIEHQMKYLLELDDSWGGVSCIMRRYKNGKLVYVTLPYKEGYIRNEVMNREIGIGTGSPLLRRKAVDDAGYFDESLLRHQDIQFFAFFCAKYKMALLKEYLYNYDLGDSQNRPTVEKLREIKDNYYKSVESILMTMSERDRHQFFIMNEFEISAIKIKSNNKREGVKSLLGVCRYWLTFSAAIKRYVDRFKGTRLKNYYNRKFSVDS